ncbi:hypothetical protein HD597_007290 [Nonomuraea thailandensis]|uniref:Uncharacterized protein n=1 Tax=Nonomuraea thailandensis TaxID=1188745 RepID=A0A9X2GM25_9ACTN|nr:hypothetical protein [Nonomuraea thailandensis]MCP2360270.1 hypothetical protein [Nonomuraea thailandensis]
MLNDHAEERRRHRRGLALRISTLLVGVLHLVLAAILIALPGSSPSLHPLPAPDADEETTAAPGTGRPVAATDPRSTSAPADPTTSTHPPTTPHAATRPSTAPQAATAPAPSTSQATPAPSRSRLRATGAVPPSEGVREASKIAPAIPPTIVNTRPPRPARTPAVAPSPEYAPPGQTREPPGRIRGSGPATPPGHNK